MFFRCFVLCMRIQTISSKYNLKNNYSTKPSFKSTPVTQSLVSKNLGSSANGFIGKLEVLKANGKKVLLNLKKSTCNDYEIYRLMDDCERVIGSIEFRFNKYQYRLNNEQDHLFVSELRNFSNTKTPDYKKELEEHKHIGTMLMQLALQRSYEEGFDGNIQLVAKNRNEVVDFYKSLGFKQPANITIYENPNRLSLSEDGKTILKNKYGGLPLII